jgi:hypothetical protein
VNLTSVGTPGLDSDMLSVARPASGAWDIGAFYFSTANRDGARRPTPAWLGWILAHEAGTPVEKGDREARARSADRADPAGRRGRRERSAKVEGALARPCVRTLRPS